MMKFKLDFDVPQSENKISHENRILLLGSCFSENIGNHLALNKFDTAINPFGTLYNPSSIFQMLSLAIDDNHSPTFFRHNELWRCWHAHSKISGITKIEVQEKYEIALAQVRDFIVTGDWIVVTPGTSMVYTHKASGQVVANCHTVPQQTFSKSMLEVKTIVSDFVKLRSKIQRINPDLKWIFTVSPVRHIRDGLIANTRSKSRLVEAIHQISENHEHTFYFPSYEILIDELRDYRFYANDLIHPSPQAVEFIWEKFAASFIDDNGLKFIHDWTSLRSAMNHSSLNPNSAAHQKFLMNTINKLEELSVKVDVKQEIAALKTLLNG
ncbi:MAG: GSCFA domain-containing protein [Cyclobacteriaceae bacterium]